MVPQQMEMIPNLPWGYQLRRDITSTRTLKGPRFFTILKSVSSDKKAWPARIHHHLSQIHLFSVSAFSSILLFVLESSTRISREPVLTSDTSWDTSVNTYLEFADPALALACDCADQVPRRHHVEVQGPTSPPAIPPRLRRTRMGPAPHWSQQRWHHVYHVCSVEDVPRFNQTRRYRLTAGLTRSVDTG